MVDTVSCCRRAQLRFCVKSSFIGLTDIVLPAIVCLNYCITLEVCFVKFDIAPNYVVLFVFFSGYCSDFISE